MSWGVSSSEWSPFLQLCHLPPHLHRLPRQVVLDRRPETRVSEPVGAVSGPRHQPPPDLVLTLSLCIEAGEAALDAELDGRIVAELGVEFVVVLQSTPKPAMEECGPNGCGGLCSTCPSKTVCSGLRSFQCLPIEAGCVPCTGDGDCTEETEACG